MYIVYVFFRLIYPTESRVWAAQQFFFCIIKNAQLQEKTRAIFDRGKWQVASPASFARNTIETIATQVVATSYVFALFIWRLHFICE